MCDASGSNSSQQVEQPSVGRLATAAPPRDNRRSRSLDRLAARVLVACAAAASLAAAARVPGSPLPVPAAGLNASSALYYITVVDSAEQTPADALTLSTLQGALARVSGRPVLVRAQPGSSYALWFTELSSFWGVALNSSFFDGQSVFDILAHFNASLQGGYIVADLNDGSVNAAVALAASRADGAVVVTADNAPKAAAAGLRLLADVTGRDLAWVLSSIGTAPFSKKVTLVQDPSKTGMADWAIATGALTWIVPNASAGALAAQVWGALEPPFFALGWGEDEFWTVRAASAAGGGVIASDWATNLDVFSAYDSPGFSQRAQASPAAAPQLTAIAAAPPARHTAAFLFSDGDNVQWILGGFATSPSFFGSPDRGRVPLGWTLSPALADLAPVAMRYLYAAASDVDVFVGALSGAAYSYSDVDAAAPGWADKLALNLAYARKAGMSYSNVMTTGTALPPAVAAGLLAADSPLQGLFHYSYSNYSLGGGVSFVGRKPVIQARFNLWGDGSQGSNFYNVRQSIDALVAAPRDPSVAAGYSLIVVHAWSHNVTDARAVMDGVLARVPPGAVAFVTPDELARQVAANVAA